MRRVWMQSRAEIIWVDVSRPRSGAKAGTAFAAATEAAAGISACPGSSAGSGIAVEARRWTFESAAPATQPRRGATTGWTGAVVRRARVVFDSMAGGMPRLQAVSHDIAVVDGAFLRVAENGVGLGYADETAGRMGVILVVVRVVSL
ncbi:hypothetical protein CMQ_776 [Grosmannia clavigera kw1407]|uniref:Uncharacterized protein n=1 Tax=Grosmannia clavigera (strain kw1407 / UAMH 11150) TaxID=655863 RepID=F0XCY8_GROCL|nr:uncharacterized protein CMQ_776 [Grosmannia clavigera kw1407]EFX03848.1 hypothetical protein CMQ_776 [Grosmannia clavigera kw1407]